MRKCRDDEVLTPVVSLATQCSKGVQFNWVKYLCQELLDDCHEVQEEGKAFQYAWIVLFIILIAWRMPKIPISLRWI